MAITHILSATTPDDPAYEIRPSHWNSAHAQLLTISGNTAGQSTYSGTNLVFEGGANATLSINGNTLVFSGGAGAAGNTGYISGGTTNASLGTVLFNNANGVSFGVDGQTVTASIASSLTNIRVSAGTTSNLLSAVTLADSNGISFGLNAGTVTAQHNALTSQSNQAFSADASSTFQTLTFQNSNGVSFSNNAGALRITHDLAGTSTGFAGANISGSMTHNSAGLNLSLSVAAPGAAAENNWFTLLGNVAGNSSASGSTIGLQGGNNITVSGTNNSQIIISAANQTNQTLGLYATGNSTQNSSSTFDARSVTFNAIGAVSMGYSNGSVQVSAPEISSLSATGNASLSSNGVTISIGANAAAISIGGNSTSAGAGYSNISSGTAVLAGGNNITLSQNGASITISAGAGGAGNTLSCFNNMDGWANSTTMQMLQSTSHVQPFILEAALSFAYLRIPMSLSNAASSTGVTTGNSSWSYGHTRSHNFVIYSRGVGASSLSLQSVASTQLTDQQSIQVSANANSTQFSYTNRATYQMSTGPVGFTHDYSSSAASLNFHTSGMTANTGLKMMEFPWATSLAAGDYWLAYGVSSSTASQYTAQGTRLFQIMSNYGMSQPNLAFGTIGAATNSSVGPYYGLGSVTTSGAAGTTASIPISAISTSGSHNKMFFQLCRIA